MYARWIRSLLSSAVAVALAGSSLLAVDRDGKPKPGPAFAPGLVTIEVADHVDATRMARGFGRISFGQPSLDAVLEAVGAEDARPVFASARRPAPGSGNRDLTRFIEIRVPENRNLDQVVRQLSQNPHITLAEKVPLQYTMASPNDPQWSSQWHMRSPGPDSRIYDAWDTETGSDSIKIAIVDTGVLYNHPDLKPNIWVNPGEDLDGDGAVYDTDDVDGLDNDGNGYVDDFIGYDFVAFISGGAFPGEDGATRDNDPKDFDGHGTHVAGIAAAANNNLTNVTGMAGGWFGGHNALRGARIMCLRAGGTRADGQGTLNSNDIADAINYAIDNGAHVINASFGGGSFSTPQNAAITNAIAAGVSYCHSAGNDDTSIPDWQDGISGVTTVASTTSSDIKASTSNYGAHIDVSSPGNSIFSTFSNAYTATVATLGGTSMAAPGVAGLNALVRSMMPSLTRAQVDTVVKMTTDNIDGVNPSYVGLLGTGRINAFTALGTLANAKFTASVTSGKAPLAVNFTDISPNSPTTWDWTFGDGNSSTLQNPGNVYTEPGVYSVGLKITEPRGLGEEHLKNYIWVLEDTLSGDSLMGARNSVVLLPISLTNTTPVKDIQFAFSLQNSVGISLDTTGGTSGGYFTTVGTRAENFGSASFLSFDNTNKRYCIKLNAYTTNDTKVLAPGTGPVLFLKVKIASNAVKGATVKFDTMTVNGRVTKFNSVWGEAVPDFKAGKVTVRPCNRGDMDNDNFVDGSDLQFLVDFIFFNGTPPITYCGDCDASGAVDGSDLQFLVDFIFFNGPPPQD